MTRLLAILGQFVLILAGFAAASMVGSLFLHALLFASAGFTLAETPEMFAAAGLFSVPFVALFVGYVAFLPACAAILVAELFALRSWLFHTTAGGGVGVLVAAFLRQAGSSLGGVAGELGTSADLAPETPLFAAIVAAGLVAGAVYWAVAGRLSGGWKRPLQLAA